jgi:myo-inositol 2-dehydrogenase/D-chiro-inositol 1-dehydrogenase
MKPDRLRLAVLGLGRIGKIHSGNLASRISGAELAAVADAAPAELSAAAGRFPGARLFSDYREALALPEVDAVAICTPTDTHYQAILDAAAAGKHIFCEKPIDLAVERIVQVIEETRRRGVQLMVGFQRRFDATFRAAGEAVRAGKIGQPQLLRITSRDPGPPPEEYIRSSGGIFLDMTIHDFDMARYLVGSEVTGVYAEGRVLVAPVFARAGDWDTALVSLEFANGALGAIDNSRKAAYGYDQRAEVFGPAGMIAAGNHTPANTVYLDADGAHSPNPLDFFLERYAGAYLDEMQEFVNAIAGGRPVPVGAEDGLKAVAIGLAATQSAREKRTVRVEEIAI